MNGMNLHLHRGWKATLLEDCGKSTLNPVALLLVARVAWGSPEVLPNSESVGDPCLINKGEEARKRRGKTSVDQQISHASAGRFTYTRRLAIAQSGYKYQAMELCRDTMINTVSGNEYCKKDANKTNLAGMIAEKGCIVPKSGGGTPLAASNDNAGMRHRVL